VASKWYETFGTTFNFFIILIFCASDSNNERHTAATMRSCREIDNDKLRAFADIYRIDFPDLATGNTNKGSIKCMHPVVNMGCWDMLNPMFMIYRLLEERCREEYVLRL